MLKDAKVAFIGCGKMGEAILSGLLTKHVVLAEQLTASAASEKRCLYLKQHHNICTSTSNIDAIQNASIIFLCVKPQVLCSVMTSLKEKIEPTALVLSIVAGVDIQTLCDGLSHEAIIRMLPNTPAQVGMGMTIWCTSPDVTDEQRFQTMELLEAMGVQLQVTKEHDIDRATAISGAGPGFIFYLIEAIIDAGVHLGLSRSCSELLALQTIAGSVELMRQTRQHPALLRNQVTSPGGITSAGLHELDKGGLRTSIFSAILASYKRTHSLTEESK